MPPYQVNCSTRGTLRERTLALLMFSMNENTGIIENVVQLENAVDEVVIIDSSSAPEHENLLKALKGCKAKVYRAIPLGYAEPLYTYGLGKVQSDYVLQLDSDERVSQELRANIRGLRACGGYLVPRVERQIGRHRHRTYSNHIRLFRKSSLSYTGYVHEYPPVDGCLHKLNRALHILHLEFPDYTSSGDVKPARRSALLLESYTRPLTLSRIGGQLGVPERILEIGDGYISPAITRLWVYLNFLKAMLSGEDFAFSRYFLIDYAKAADAYSRSLDRQERNVRLKIFSQMKAHGGLIHYLGLDVPDYIEGLTSVFDWRTPGIEVFELLVRSRYTKGTILSKEDFRVLLSKRLRLHESAPVNRQG